MNCPTLEVPVHERPASESDDAPRCWMVRHGKAVVGPVTLTLIERGLAAGKLPAEAEVAHVDRQSWMPVQALFVDGPHGTSGIRSVPQPPSIPPAPPVPALAPPKTLASPKVVPAIPDDPKPAPAWRTTVKIEDPDAIEDPESFVDTVPAARAVRASEVPEWPVGREAVQAQMQQQAPQAQPSQPFAEEPVSIPKQGFWESLFG